MSVTVSNKRMTDILDDSQSLKLLIKGFAFSEGPVWHPAEHHIIFSDIPNSKTYRWSEETGLDIYRDPTNMANGNSYDKSDGIVTMSDIQTAAT